MVILYRTNLSDSLREKKNDKRTQNFVPFWQHSFPKKREGGGRSRELISTLKEKESVINCHHGFSTGRERKALLCKFKTGTIRHLKEVSKKL